MEIKRRYQPRAVNWFLVPDLLNKVAASIPDHQKTDSLTGYKLLPVPQFTIKTYSQTVEIESAQDFPNFINTSSESPTEVEARLECIKQYPDKTTAVTHPDYFELSWREDELKIQIWRSASQPALQVLDEFEKALQLEPLKLVEQTKEQANDEEPLQRTVFIAHSFDEKGRSYAYQLTKFLSLLGFEIATGEGFSPESVSTKVKRRLSAQELVITILSEKDEHTWLIQETAGASFAEKPLFVLVEEGVDFKPAVLGDLEYISFAKGKISDCFTPILEGLRELGFEFTGWE